MSTCATDTAADATRIVVEMALHPGDTVGPSSTSALSQESESTRRTCSSFLVGPAHHKNTNAKAERVNGVLGDTLWAFANGRNDDWDVMLPYQFTVFAIDNEASTQGGKLTPTPFVIDPDHPDAASPRLPPSLSEQWAAFGTPAACATRMRPMMRALEKEVLPVLALLHAAQQERALLRQVRQRPKQRARPFRWATNPTLRTKELFDSSAVGQLLPRGGGPFAVAAVASPNMYTLTLPARFNLPSSAVRRSTSSPTSLGPAGSPPQPCHRPGSGRVVRRGGGAAQP